MRRSTFSFVFFASYLLVSLLACGRQSSPKPPEDRAPAGISAARLIADSNSVTLFWKPPTQTAGGDDLRPLDSYTVLKRLNESSNHSGRFYELARVAHREVKEQGSQSSEEYTFRDPEVVLGRQYEYLIIPEDEDGYQGLPTTILRVTFVGISSSIELLPFSEDDF